MLIKMLPEPEKKLLLDLIQLLALSDNPILWDGKKYDELTSDTNLSNLSIQADEQENELIADLERSAGQSVRRESNTFGPGVSSGSIYAFFSQDMTVGALTGTSSVERELIERIKLFPIHKMELPETRVAAAQTVLAQLLEGQSATRPEPPKIMLFEMILVALRDGSISSIERELLKAFQHHYQIADFIFEDLLDRAEALNSEVSKTIALVLE
ncbi:hypothetical protein GO594_23230 [Pseudomonas otitidis]|uniref:Co-chaperone DjlA N-terminal domain-containing protein n=1 Tax=Metapseudomonas otitidis TaxID=319939 RepID=A0A7X3HBF3_9GAMM|nr:hypothetical protein [Pseudomonas otitidis]MWK58907.1 hypothetical protein [Pseudomonas otitidis]